MKGINKRLLHVLVVILRIMTCILGVIIFYPTVIIGLFEWILTGNNYTWRPLTWLMDWAFQDM